MIKIIEIKGLIIFQLNKIVKGTCISSKVIKLMTILEELQPKKKECSCGCKGECSISKSNHKEVGKAK